MFMAFVLDRHCRKNMTRQLVSICHTVHRSPSFGKAVTSVVVVPSPQ